MWRSEAFLKGAPLKAIWHVRPHKITTLELQRRTRSNNHISEIKQCWLQTNLQQSSVGLDKVSGTSQAEESSRVKSRKRDSQAYNTVSFPTLAPHKSCVLSLSSLTLINNLKHNLFPPQELIPTSTHHPHTWYQPPLHCTINSSPNSCGISSSRTIHAAFWKKVKQGWSRSCGRAVNHHHFIRLE